MFMRAILVEDDIHTREALAISIRDLTGLEIVGAAATVEGALTLAGRIADWQLMVLDLALQDGSGITVLSELQDRGDKRIVVLTNFTDGDLRIQCERLGADAMFDKSAELDAFIDYCHQYGSVWGMLT